VPKGSASASTQSDQTSPEEHLQQAKAALDDVNAGSVEGPAKTQLAELKRHMAALSRASSSAAADPTSAANTNWATEVAAMNKLLVDLIGSGSATSGATDAKTTAGASATGTSGSGVAGTAGTTGSKESSPNSSSANLDAATRAKLTEVHTHLTAYAAAKGTGTAAPKGGTAASTTSSSATGATPSASTASSTNGVTASTEQSSTGAQGSASSQSGAASTPSTTAPSTAAPAGAGQSGAPASGATASDPAAASAVQAQPAGQVDEEAARRALTAARDNLSQLTQLPAATQLNGEARAQVAQLISNFNELITTQVQWRASYAKVAGNLNTLLGPDNTDAEAAAGAPAAAGSAGTTAAAADPSVAGTASAPAPGAGSSTPGAAGTSGSSPAGSQPGTTAGAGAAATSGAVGTSGSTIQVDPTIRAKLIELRQNLKAFEKASGGAEK